MRIQSAFAAMKPTGISFGIRLPNKLAPSFPRPMASVSHSEIRCAVVTLRKVWISNTRQNFAMSWQHFTLQKRTSIKFFMFVSLPRSLRTMKNCMLLASGFDIGFL
jgi:hypothetical protein